MASIRLGMTGYDNLMFPKDKQQTSVSACNLCGTIGAMVDCDKCQSMAFCLSCDDMYHRHPKRRFHLRRALPINTKSGEAKGALKTENFCTNGGQATNGLSSSAHPSKMPIPPPRTKKRGDTLKRAQTSVMLLPPQNVQDASRRFSLNQTKQENQQAHHLPSRMNETHRFSSLTPEPQQVPWRNVDVKKVPWRNNESQNVPWRLNEPQRQGSFSSHQPGLSQPTYDRPHELLRGFDESKRGSMPSSGTSSDLSEPWSQDISQESTPPPLPQKMRSNTLNMGANRKNLSMGDLTFENLESLREPLYPFDGPFPPYMYPFGSPYGQFPGHPRSCGEGYEDEDDRSASESSSRAFTPIEGMSRSHSRATMQRSHSSYQMNPQQYPFQPPYHSPNGQMLPPYYFYPQYYPPHFGPPQPSPPASLRSFRRRKSSRDRRRSSSRGSSYVQRSPHGSGEHQSNSGSLTSLTTNNNNSKSNNGRRSSVDPSSSSSYCRNQERSITPYFGSESVSDSQTPDDEEDENDYCSLSCTESDGSLSGPAYNSPSNKEWSCKFCTFVNHPSRDICEVCAKSNPKRLKNKSTKKTNEEQKTTSKKEEKGINQGNRKAAVVKPSKSGKQSPVIEITPELIEEQKAVERELIRRLENERKIERENRRLEKREERQRRRGRGQSIVSLGDSVESLNGSEKKPTDLRPSSACTDTTLSPPATPKEWTKESPVYEKKEASECKQAKSSSSSAASESKSDKAVPQKDVSISQKEQMPTSTTTHELETAAENIVKQEITNSFPAENLQNKDQKAVGKPTGESLPVSDAPIASSVQQNTQSPQVSINNAPGVSAALSPSPQPPSVTNPVPQALNAPSPQPAMVASPVPLSPVPQMQTVANPVPQMPNVLNAQPPMQTTCSPTEQIGLMQQSSPFGINYQFQGFQSPVMQQQTSSSCYMPMNSVNPSLSAFPNNGFGSAMDVRYSGQLPQMRSSFGSASHLDQMGAKVYKPLASLFTPTQQFPVNVPTFPEPQRYLSVDDIHAATGMLNKQQQQQLQHQDHMQSGFEMLKLLRDAEKKGFCAEDVEVALNFNPSNPMDWLEENWPNMVETVLTLANNQLMQKEKEKGTSKKGLLQIPLVSEEEAKEVLRNTKGNIWQAIERCVKLKDDNRVEGGRKKIHKDASSSAPAGKKKDGGKDAKSFTLQIRDPGLGVENLDGNKVIDAERRASTVGEEAAVAASVASTRSASAAGKETKPSAVRKLSLSSRDRFFNAVDPLVHKEGLLDKPLSSSPTVSSASASATNNSQKNLEPPENVSGTEKRGSISRVRKVENLRAKLREEMPSQEIDGILKPDSSLSLEKNESEPQEMMKKDAKDEDAEREEQEDEDEDARRRFIEEYFSDEELDERVFVKENEINLVDEDGNIVNYQEDEDEDEDEYENGSLEHEDGQDDEDEEEEDEDEEGDLEGRLKEKGFFIGDEEDEDEDDGGEYVSEPSQASIDLAQDLDSKLSKEKNEGPDRNQREEVGEEEESYDQEQVTSVTESIKNGHEENEEVEEEFSEEEEEDEEEEEEEEEKAVEQFAGPSGNQTLELISKERIGNQALSNVPGNKSAQNSSNLGDERKGEKETGTSKKLKENVLNQRNDASNKILDSTWVSGKKVEVEEAQDSTKAKQAKKDGCKTKLVKNKGDVKDANLDEIKVSAAAAEEGIKAGDPNCGKTEAQASIGINQNVRTTYECELCTGTYRLSDMVSLLACDHQACIDCLTQYYTVQIRERQQVVIPCPYCSQPEINPDDEDAVCNYLASLDLLLKTILPEEVHELFERKVRDRALQKDPLFRWCAQCSSGFIASNPYARTITCPDCRVVTCAKCNSIWEEQHSGITCEAFAEWKKANDPDFAEKQLDLHLKQFGIDCPNCKFHYELSKGGCIHFHCVQCGHDFCGGCQMPFRMGYKCTQSKWCNILGLHAHHPRNCLFYLRDREVEELKRLLEINGIDYSIKVSPELENAQRCSIMEQREQDGSLRDLPCGKEVLTAGLCKSHYMEYLSELIRKNGVDPVAIFDENEMVHLLRRADVKIPIKTNPKTHLENLRQVIREELPLCQRE